MHRSGDSGAKVLRQEKACLVLGKQKEARVAGEGERRLRRFRRKRGQPSGLVWGSLLVVWITTYGQWGIAEVFELPYWFPFSGLCVLWCGGGL